MYYRWTPWYWCWYWYEGKREIGEEPVINHQTRPGGLTLDRAAESASQDQIVRRERLKL